MSQSPRTAPQKPAIQRQWHPSCSPARSIRGQNVSGPLAFWHTAPRTCASTRRLLTAPWALQEAGATPGCEPLGSGSSGSEAPQRAAERHLQLPGQLTWGLEGREHFVPASPAALQPHGLARAVAGKALHLLVSIQSEREQNGAGIACQPQQTLIHTPHPTPTHSTYTPHPTPT